MISPSPEFPVTKVGMSTRRRDKPLRTYGRRPSTTPDASSNKKRKATHEPSPLAIADDLPAEKAVGSAATEVGDESKETTDSTPSEPHNEEENLAKEKKGSIKCFFKPVLPKLLGIEAVLEPEKKPTMAAEAEVVSDAEAGEQSATPTSEHAAKRRKKAPRLLRLRPNLPSDESMGENKENQAPATKPNHQSQSGKAPLTTTLAKSNNEKDSSSLQPKRAPSIQTTLNISSRATFSECRLCNTVWNPSFADDMKYHKRRHAAVLRQRRSSTITD